MRSCLPLLSESCFPPVWASLPVSHTLLFILNLSFRSLTDFDPSVVSITPVTFFVENFYHVSLLLPVCNLLTFPIRTAVDTPHCVGW